MIRRRTPPSTMLRFLLRLTPLNFLGTLGAVRMSMAIRPKIRLCRTCESRCRQKLCKTSHLCTFACTALLKKRQPSHWHASPWCILRRWWKHSSNSMLRPDLLRTSELQRTQEQSRSTARLRHTVVLRLPIRLEMIHLCMLACTRIRRALPRVRLEECRPSSCRLHRRHFGTQPTRSGLRKQV